MKKLILMLLVATMSVTAFAQGQFRRMEPKEQATRRADQLKETCGINDEQYKKVYDLYFQQAQETDSIFKAMQNGGGQPQFDREAFQKRQEAQRAAIKAILTPEQFEKYEKAEAERRSRRGGFGGGGFGGGGFGGGFGGGRP